MTGIYTTLALSVVWTAKHLDKSTFSLGQASIIFSCILSAAQLEEVKELKKKLFEGYDRYVRPVLNQSEAVYMNMAFHLFTIDNLDLKSQKLKWSGFLSMKLHDEQLSWKSSEYGDTDFLVMPQSKIWLPDVVLSNNLRSDRTLGSPDTLVFIRSSGLVVWEPGIVTETSCKIDIRKYPFDKQTCTFDFMPWMTTKSQLNISSSIDAIVLSAFSSHGEFVVTGSPVEIKNATVSYLEDDITQVIYTVVLRRRPTFYWLIMIFPMITFPLLCPISFLVPTECGEKITLSITIVLSFLVFTGSMSDAMPQVSDTVSLLVVYSSVQTTISMLTVVSNIIIISISWLPGDFTFRPRKKPKILQENNNIMNAISQTSNNFTVTRDPDPGDCAKMEDTQSGNKTQKWTKIARKMDTICFVSFMALTIIVSGIFAVIIF